MKRKNKSGRADALNQIPKSICVCGHSGDGPNSYHADNAFVLGHGPCSCCDGCVKFTWARWSAHYEVVTGRRTQGGR